MKASDVPGCEGVWTGAVLSYGGGLAPLQRGAYGVFASCPHLSTAPFTPTNNGKTITSRSQSLAARTDAHPSNAARTDAARHLVNGLPIAPDLSFRSTTPHCPTGCLLAAFARAGRFTLLWFSGRLAVFPGFLCRGYFFFRPFLTLQGTGTCRCAAGIPFLSLRSGGLGPFPRRLSLWGR